MIVEELEGIKKEDFVDHAADEIEEENSEPEELTAEEEMMRVMGFAGFDSSKGKEVDTNVASAAAGAVRKVYKFK